jgi:hypothetical protein
MLLEYAMCAKMSLKVNFTLSLNVHCILIWENSILNHISGKKPSTFKLVKLLCTYNLKQLRHLGAYMFKDVKLRTITVSLLSRCVYYVFTMYVNVLQLSFCPCIYWLIYLICTDEPIGSKSIKNWNVTTKRWAWPPSYTHACSTYTYNILSHTKKFAHKKAHI